MDGAARRRKESLTIALLIVGYAGYYICRSHLSVCAPLILAEFKSIGFDKVRLGAITSTGTVAYAIGKMIFGSASPRLSGRGMFLGGMAGAIITTIAFAVFGPAVFLIAWTTNRGVQSSGWVGIIKVVGAWFDPARYGGVMGLISLSYLVGDAFSEWGLSQLIAWGWGWRQVFFAAAASLTLIFIANFIALRDRPAVPVTLSSESEPAGSSVFTVVGKLFRRRTFLLVCVLSFAFTFLRQTFNEWLPTFLKETTPFDVATSGKLSSLFPLFGAVAVVIVGFASDRVASGMRAVVMFLGLLLATCGLIYLSRIGGGSSLTIYGAIIAFLALTILGPYSLLAGAMSLDIGGSKNGALAAGWIDGIGYLGGIMSGLGIATIVQHNGWDRAFTVLAVVAFVSSLIALFLAATPKHDA